MGVGRYIPGLAGDDWTGVARHERATNVSVCTSVWGGVAALRSPLLVLLRVGVGVGGGGGGVFGMVRVVGGGRDWRRRRGVTARGYSGDVFVNPTSKATYTPWPYGSG